MQIIAEINLFCKYAASGNRLYLGSTSHGLILYVDDKISKCKWEPDELPVVPIAPITSPWPTL
jgi:hypothetical protein